MCDRLCKDYESDDVRETKASSSEKASRLGEGAQLDIHSQNIVSSRED